MIKINSLLRSASLKLSQSGVDNPDEETRILFEFAGGPCKKEQILNGISETDENTAGRFSELLKERLSGRPLQYILGQWDFYGNPFYVGEGVLIPRAETEMLIDESDYFLKGTAGAKVLDLCSGTGCIGITAALHNPSAQVFAVEKSEDAFLWLEKNINKFNLSNIRPVRSDIFDGAGAIINSAPFDILLSNPPYIASDEIATLQKEVAAEPRTALDGGKDGLDFYRAIRTLWLPLLKKDALVCVECGEEQTDEVASLFSDCCDNISIKKDFNNLPRTVTANYRGE